MKRLVLGGRLNPRLHGLEVEMVDQTGERPVMDALITVPFKRAADAVFAGFLPEHPIRVPPSCLQLTD